MKPNFLKGLLRRVLVLLRYIWRGCVKMWNWYRRTYKQARWYGKVGIVCATVVVSFVLYLILAVNALFVGMLILSAYSPYLQPKIHPIASCLGLAFPIFLAVNICFTLFWVIISYRYALLPVIGFLVCIPQIRTYIPINSTVETIPDGSIKFLSYNVMGFNNLEKKEGKNPVFSKDKMPEIADKLEAW